MKQLFSKFEYQEAKEFLKDAQKLSAFITPTYSNTKWIKPDGSEWHEAESHLEPPEDDYSLVLIRPAMRELPIEKASKIINEYLEGYRSARKLDPMCGITWVYDEETYHRISAFLGEGWLAE